MRGPRGRLSVIYADDALKEIDEIADWNEKTYNRAHAREYIRFEERHIDALARDFAKGRPVSTRPELRYIRIQKTSKAYGHVAVYIFDNQTATVVHVLHTSQDWENRLAEEQK
jgi:plasmid stabilization system protein ParE